MTSMNFKYTYTSSEDVVAKCVKRRSAFNIINKQLITSNQSAEFTKARMLQRKGLGGTTIFIKSEEDASSGSNNNNNNNNNNNGNNNNNVENNTSQCPTFTRKKPIMPLTNKF